MMKHKFDFLKKSKFTIGISFILLVIGIVSIILKGGFKLGIDFAGGTAFNMYFPSNIQVSEADLKDMLNKYGISGEVTTSRSLGAARKNSFYVTLREYKMQFEGKQVSSSDLFLYNVFKKYDKVYFQPYFKTKNTINVYVKDDYIDISKLVKVLEPTDEELQRMQEQSRSSASNTQNTQQAQTTAMPAPENVDEGSVKPFKTRLVDGNIYKLKNGKGFKIQLRFPSNISNIDIKDFQSKFQRLLLERLRINKIQTVRIEGRQFIGPKIGKYFIRVSIEVIILVSIIILVYIAIRFEFKFGLAAVLALLHDTILMLAFVSIVDVEMDITIVAALITIIGYSINDTIVIFDRIRENTEKISTNKSEYVMIVNRSIHESMSRTLITSLTTLLVVVVLLIWGGDTIFNFYLLLLIGVVVGTYSSIFIASPALVVWDRFIERRNKRRKRKLKKA